MIICFDCTTSTKKNLDFFMESGQYEDYSQIISTALSNMLILQKEMHNKGSIIINSELTDLNISKAKSKKIEKTFKKSKNDLFQYEQFISSNQLKLNSFNNIKIPNIFLLNEIKQPPTKLLNMPDDVWTIGQEIPLDRWVLSMYNKIFPAKANCRALVNLLKEDINGVPLNKAIQIIVNEVITLGDYLTGLDDKYKIDRYKLLSTALPNSANGGEKSKDRYSNHFIGYINKNGQLSSLLMAYKFINYTNDKIPRLFLTNAGWIFTELSNPILDSPIELPIKKFSNKEIEFLIDHISKNVPAEDFAFRSTLKIVNEGSNTPEKIDKVLREIIPTSNNKTFNDSFFTSQRSGVVSRMIDLDLIIRNRDGIKVSYELTDRGKKYPKF